jgi:hypothetical protein
MATSDDRQARALEGILGQMTFLVAEMRVLNVNLASVHEELQQMGVLEEADESEMTLDINSLSPLKTESGRVVGYMLPGEEIRVLRHPLEAEMEIAVVSNRPGVGEFVKSVNGPFDIHVFNIAPRNGQMLFTGMTDDGVNPSKRINGTIQDVY